jgi:hypothetical protein
MDKNKCPKMKNQNTFGKINLSFYIINSQSNLKKPLELFKKLNKKYKFLNV